MINVLIFEVDLAKWYRYHQKQQVIQTNIRNMYSTYFMHMYQMLVPCRKQTHYKFSGWWICIQRRIWIEFIWPTSGCFAFSNCAKEQSGFWKGICNSTSFEEIFLGFKSNAFWKWFSPELRQKFWNHTAISSANFFEFLLLY